MSDELRTEVDHNYDFFQRNLATYIAEEQSGRYALLRSARLVDFFDAPGEAYREAVDLFPDGIFSIQKVTDQPIDMGMWSLDIH